MFVDMTDWPWKQSLTVNGAAWPPWPGMCHKRGRRVGKFFSSHSDWLFLGAANAVLGHHWPSRPIHTLLRTASPRLALLGVLFFFLPLLYFRRFPCISRSIIHPLSHLIFDFVTQQTFRIPIINFRCYPSF
ncbi:hypothetical protein LY76DRAFT_298663 [Colletotrichum caudatum]|nr:hypothetical protein LY76DRAFT_298663 [Colletotrichum caudatum]